MLTSIHIKNCFAHKDTKVDFEKGVTKIQGPNESGKSLIFEMIRYALFGAKALRGEAADYKATWVELVFSVAGQSYTVTRTSKDAILKKDDEFVARSTSAVSAKIIEIIGYGLKTFDNINSISQAEVEKLTKLSAPERKKFTDELIGASQIDELVKEYKAEADIANASAEALAFTLETIDEPVKPQGYQPVAILEAKRESLNETRRTIDRKKAARDALVKQRSTLVGLSDPLPAKTLEDVEHELEEHDNHQKRLRELTTKYPEIARMVAENIHIEDYRAFELACDSLAKVSALPRPPYRAEELADLDRKWKEQTDFETISALRSQVSAMETCAHCGKTFDAEKGPLVDQINRLEPTARPHRGLPSREAIAEAKAALAAYDKAYKEASKVDQKYMLPAKYCMFKPVAKTEFETVYAMLDKGVEDASDLRAAVSAKRMKARQEETDRDIAAVEAELSQFDEAKINEDYDQTFKLIHAVGNYDMAMTFWEKAIAKNKGIEAKVKVLTDEATSKKNVAKSLNEFKYYINTYFLPAVAKSASSMLSTMTNGVRRRVHISDKFEITVDGQKVNTLSGSALALVNISLRLAFQYVLTRNNFSVFMGDEIDASMDEDRAKYLSECLSNMSEFISQIIIISHEAQFSADQTIRLK